MQKNWDELKAEFEGIYHREVKRSRAARSIKNLKFPDFKKDRRSDEKAFRMLIG